jgi:hypothetical protein
MSQATGASALIEEVPVEKRERKKRGSGVLSQVNSLAKNHEQTGKEIEKLRIEARAAEAKKDEDNARLVKLVRTGFGGKFEGTVKNHIAFTEDDLAFFRSFGFNV